MNRVLNALLVLLCFELGVLLLLLPWSGIWEHNYFLTHFPSLIHIVLHPSFRGAVSGLGLLDVGLAAGMIRRRQAPSVATRS
jgi:hypothetical protein